LPRNRLINWRRLWEARQLDFMYMINNPETFKFISSIVDVIGESKKFRSDLPMYFEVLVFIVINKQQLRRLPG
jgi:hypothetical protein